MTREEILQELGIQNADTATQDEIIENILTVVENRFSGIVEDLLSDDQQRDLTSIVNGDNNNPETIAKWLEDNVPAVSELYVATLGDYIEELKGKQVGLGR